MSKTFKDCVNLLGNTHDWRIAYPVLLQAGQAALADVLEGLSHPNWRVRKWCVAFLDHNATTLCSNALVIALYDSSAEVRRHAVHSIGCQGCKPSPLKADIVGLLIDKVIRDQSIRVRRCAAHMLGCQPTDRRVPPLMREILHQERDAKLCSNAKWSLQMHECVSV